MISIINRGDYSMERLRGSLDGKRTTYSIHSWPRGENEGLLCLDLHKVRVKGDLICSLFSGCRFLLSAMRVHVIKVVHMRGLSRGHEGLS